MPTVADVSEVCDLAVRIMSAAVGVVIAVIVFILHDTVVFPIAIALIIGMMIFELLKAADCIKFLPAAAASIAYGVSVPLSYGFDAILPSYTNIYRLIAVLVIFFNFIMKHKEIRFEKAAYILAVTVLVPSAMLTTMKVESMEYGLSLMILGLCGAWIADSGAYFAGTFLGKHKLCPEISPKKTVEGFVGGILTTGIVFVVYCLVYSRFIADDEPDVNYIVAFLAGCVCAVIGTLGDLSASMIKRQTGIKDYGKIMPGHGGVMDRFDSVLFVMPVFYSFLTLFDFYK